MSEPRGKLAKFCKKHPNTDLYVRQYIGFACVLYLAQPYPQVQWGYFTVDRFSRDRDAWRRLRQLGYTREGEVWRLVPKQQQAIPPLRAAIQGIAPIFNTSDV